MSRILALIRPPGYNPPINWAMLWNQWLHKGYLWSWYSYEFYSEHSREV